MKGHAIIIAASGMCSGGRIVDHLKLGLEDPGNDIVFVGYQAEGTLGHRIMEQRSRPGFTVMIDGERVTLRARVHTPTGYSTHADQKGLVDWVASMPEKPSRIKLVHWDAGAKKALGVRLRELGYNVR